MGVDLQTNLRPFEFELDQPVDKTPTSSYSFREARIHIGEYLTPPSCYWRIGCDIVKSSTDFDIAIKSNQHHVVAPLTPDAPLLY